MKNLLLILGCLGIISVSFAQEGNLQINNYSFQIKDTVSTPVSGKYYLTKIPENDTLHPEIIRRVNNELVIVKEGLSYTTQKNVSFFLLNDSWKLSSRLLRNKPSYSDGKHLFSIKYAPDTPLEFLSHKEVEVIRRINNAHIVIVKTSFEVVETELLGNHSVEYIDLAEQTPVEESPIRQYSPDLNRISTAKHNYPMLKGENMMISLKENSINDEDIDLMGKVILDENSSENFTQHAKEMGTLLAGLGNSFKTGEGVVPKARLVCTDFSSLFAEDAAYYNAYSIKVQNHSYGTGIENFYGNESISYDQISVDIPQLIHVFSAGNAGALAPDAGTYAGIAGYANLTGDYKQAKNVLVVTALDSAQNHASPTSSGPAYDGRIKPELSAFGGEGSSESAALASGCVAMIQNLYANINGFFPTSSLIKSMLIAGANEAHTPGIDYRTGYGSINLNRSLQLLDAGRYDEGVLNANDTDSIQLTVPDNAAELKVVVSWIDPPAQPEDAKALVNDLDMSLTAPDNTLTLPWVLNTTPDASALAAKATRSEDHLNNVEMISIENPNPGVYTVRITANQLVGNNQTYSMAYQIKIRDKFEWSFPTVSDYLEGGSSLFFRWENTYPDQNGNLFIKYGDGEWEFLGQVNVADEHFKTVLKDTTAFAMLKMELSSATFLSDTFTITSLPEINVENDCNANFILSWKKHENTDHYVLYELQSNEFVPVLTTTDTLVRLDKSVFSGEYYALQPIQSPMLEGLRSYAVNYENRNQGCYLTNFLVNLTLEHYANLQLSINVPSEIQEIAILKEFQGSQEVFQQFSPEGNIHFTFEDHDLIPGKYTYFAQLTLQDGSMISSDTLTLFYTDLNTVIVFPNPAQDNFVNLLNDYAGGLLQLMDEKGSLIRNYDLVNTVETLDLTGVPEGLYLFRIIYEDRVVNAGKIIRL